MSRFRGKGVNRMRGRSRKRRGKKLKHYTVARGGVRL